MPITEFDRRLWRKVWRVDDPRVITALAAENAPNTPSARTRAANIGQRAAAAGWPSEVYSTKHEVDRRAQANYRKRRRAKRAAANPGQEDRS